MAAWSKINHDELRLCIVLYLYIYIALLEVHTNQTCFQCERPREKRAVLRERKEALGSPANKVDRAEGRNWFQSEGPMIAKEVLACNNKMSASTNRLHCSNNNEILIIIITTVSMAVPV